MDLAKELILTLKQNNKSHVGYGLQKESEALVGHILQNMAKAQLPALVPETKNEEDAIRYREEGNQHFVMGDDTEAIESYTLSLAYADNDELMAYAHANRSAALYRKQMYKECLIDIDAALSLGYPEEKRKKLRERGAKAIEEIKKNMESNYDRINAEEFVNFCLSEPDNRAPINIKYRNGKSIENEEETKKSNDNVKTRENRSSTPTEVKFANGESVEDKEETKQSNNNVKTLENKNSLPTEVKFANGGNVEDKEELKKLDDKCCNVKTREVVNGNNNVLFTEKVEKKPRYLADEGELKLVYGPSKEAPAASEGVSISFSEKYGRHLVATKEFHPGDIVTMETPYAHVIYADRYYTHCHQCLSRSYNLIPCPKCPIAQYCSEKCRKLAWKIAHQTECSVLALLTNLLNVDKDKIRMLTKIIRLLIVVTDNGTKIGELRGDMRIAESNPDSRTAGFTDEGILDSSSARSALSLATNMTTRPLIGISAFACISALAAILLATQTNFFQKKYEVDQLKDISNLPELRFCGSLMFRACVIMSSNCFSVQQEPGIKSGSGLYVTHSLYNHSCAPNTFRHFEGLTMITRALEPISPGNQIFTSYGAGYAYMTRPERREKIMQDYFFECDCDACACEWPTYNEILRNHIGSVSKNKELVAKLKPYKQRLMKNMYDIDAVKTVLGILYKEVSQPCEEIVHAEQYLKSYYLGKFK